LADPNHRLPASPGAYRHRTACLPRPALPVDLPRTGNELGHGLRAHFDPDTLKDGFTEGTTFIGEPTKVPTDPATQASSTA